MKKSLPPLFIALLTLFSLTLLQGSSIRAQNLTWQKEGAIFDDPTIYDVEVLPLAEGGYRMYFQQEGGIKTATSSDGKNFTIEEGIRLQGEMPTVVKISDGKWRMYFVKQAAIHSATSKDGLKWTIEKGTRLTAGGQYDPDNIAHPAVIALPTGGYRMYYDGEVHRTEQDYTWRILSATSEDGLSWVKDEEVRINVEEAPLYANLVWSPCTEYDNSEGLYHLYFATKQSSDSTLPNGIYSATSHDGLIFTVSHEPELASENGETSSYQDPFVLGSPEGKRMYYRVNGSGIYSAVLAEGPEQEQSQKSIWKDTFANILERFKLNKIKISLPPNLELFIVPGILLATGTAALVIFWKSRYKRE